MGGGVGKGNRGTTAGMTFEYIVLLIHRSHLQNSTSCVIVSFFQLILPNCTDIYYLSS